MLTLAVGFALLLIEVRYYHQGVLGQSGVAWVPIFYSAAMILGCGAALIGWERGGRRILFWVFALGLIVAALGYLFHNADSLTEGLRRELAVWTQPAARAPLNRPPVLAPFAFAGLGLLGMIACAGRFQPRSESGER